MLKVIPFFRQTVWLFQGVLLAAAMTGCGGSIPAPADTTAATATVTLQGQVTDAATGEPIVGATVAIGMRTATTDAAGRYEMLNFPAIAAAASHAIIRPPSR